MPPAADPHHEPVLRDRILDLFAPCVTDDGAVLVDGTLGLGGHTESLLDRFDSLRVIGIDRDRDAIRRATERLRPFGDRFTAIHSAFDGLTEALVRVGARRVNGVLLDLGVSSMQLDQAERGFAYSVDAPLDMRMDEGTERTAARILAEYSAAELADVLRRFGDENFARRIAARIVERRATAPVTRSAELVELIYDAVPQAARRTGGHPAKRTFQALRMEVNDELGMLRRVLPQALASVHVGGRVVVESYHSGEDKLVKQTFVAACTSAAPPDLPVVPDDLQPRFRAVTRGAEQATETETEANPRAASVRLRAIERVREGEPTSVGTRERVGA